MISFNYKINGIAMPCSRDQFIKLISDEVYQPLRADCGSIRRMLIASVTTVKKNNE